MDDLDTKTLLINWAVWAGKNPLKTLCYPSVEPFRKFYTLPGEVSPPIINEEYAIKADKILAAMIKRNEVIGVTTALYYLVEPTYEALAEKINRHVSGSALNRKKVAVLVSEGESWFEGYFFGLEHNFQQNT